MVFSLEKANVAILGLGFMGGSIALSLKDRCKHLSALDTHAPTIELARSHKIVHLADSDPALVLAKADLVILACPVPAIIEWLQSLPQYIQKPCIVLDIGSSKRMIVNALEQLPPNFDPLGGHAICGSERLSLINAEASLFKDAPFVLTPLKRSSENARNAALQLIQTLGAFPIWLNAEEHDRILASTSHLPYLLSSALSLLVPLDEAGLLIGPGFRSSARLAGTPSNMMLGVLQSNRDNVQLALQKLQEQLALIESALLEKEPDNLIAILDSAQSQYRSLTQSRVKS
jgi:prephenate dehydrogenase